VRPLVLVIVVAACTDSKPNPQGPPWTEVDLPGDPAARRIEAGATALGDRLIVLGGISTSDTEVPPRQITQEVLAFNTLAGTWEQLPDAPVAWSHANLAGVGGVLYLLGGLEGNQFFPRGDCFVLEQGAPEWAPLPAQPAGQERGASGVVVDRGHVYLLGGISATGNGYFGNTLDFDLTSRTWSVLDIPAFNERSHLAAMREYDGTFVIAGGLGVPGALGDTYQLHLGGDHWELGEPMPLVDPNDEISNRRSGCAYGNLLDQLVCAGGDDGQQAFDSVLSYDPVLDKWTERPAMPMARAGARGAVVAQRLYVPGGSASLMFQPESTLFVFSPDTAP
jgi:Kelch motif protein/galactose oxidase-like protein